MDKLTIAQRRKSNDFFNKYHKDILFTCAKNLDALTESEKISFIWQGCISAAKRPANTFFSDSHVKNYISWVFRKRAYKATGKMYRYLPPPVYELSYDEEQAIEHKALLSELIGKYGFINIMRLAGQINNKTYAIAIQQSESKAFSLVSKLRKNIRKNYKFCTGQTITTAEQSIL